MVVSKCKSGKRSPYVVKCSRSPCTICICGSSRVAVRGLRVIGAKGSELPNEANMGIRLRGCNATHSVALEGLCVRSIGNDLMGGRNKKSKVCVIGRKRGPDVFSKLAVRGYVVHHYRQGKVV